MISVPPFLIFLVGMALIPFLKGPVKKIYMLLIPAITFIEIMSLEQQTSYVYSFLGLNIILLQVDRLSLIVGYIFMIIGFLAILYSLHVKENGQILAAYSYVGSSIGVVFAGDFFSLFVFSEIMAFTSLALIWYQKEKRSMDAGFRYILMHVFAGLSLFAGILIHYMATGSIEITRIEGLAMPFFFIGVGLNTAFIFIHTWLPDSYPKATITGAIFLSVYTTKTGVYVLARTLPGYEVVAYMGGIMVIYGVVFALLQNDARKLLSYHIVSQVGYMVAGIGIGTAMGIDGGIAHVFNHILYKALLFMGVGAVIFGTGGRMHLTELGGLWKKMPLTMVATMIAAFSISGIPGFNGFISKGLVISAAGLAHMPILQLVLILGSIGTFLSFLKLTYFIFFNKPKEEIKVRSVPLHMKAAMGITASLCVLLGVYPQLLFSILPFEFAKYNIEYNAFSLEHVTGVFQLMMMTAVVFFLGLKYFTPHRRITFDVDYIYRAAGRSVIWIFLNPVSSFGRLTERYFFDKIPGWPLWFSRNPLAAIDIICDRLKCRDAAEKKKRYPNIAMPMQVVSSTVILTIVFLSVWLLIIKVGWMP